MKLKHLILLPLFLSCATVRDSGETDYVKEPVLVELLRQIDDDVKSAGIEQPIEAPPLRTLEIVDVLPFGTPDNAIAVCTITLDQATRRPVYGEIRVLRSGLSNTYKLKRLLAHENFHCNYLKNHNDPSHIDKEGFFYPHYEKSDLPWDALKAKYLTKAKFDEAPNIIFPNP